MLDSQLKGHQFLTPMSGAHLSTHAKSATSGVGNSAIIGMETKSDNVSTNESAIDFPKDQINSNYPTYIDNNHDNKEEWENFFKINANKPAEYTQYQDYNIRWRDTSEYRLIKHIGRGKYSEVFLGKMKPLVIPPGSFGRPNEPYRVIKVIKPNKYVKVLREIKILTDVAGHKNIVSLMDVIKDETVLFD
ncbi:MAG: Casein kinase II subunit alpha' [Paramarteilia canceri]